MTQGKRYLVTATTFPKYDGDPAPRFVLDTCIGLQNKGKEVLALCPHTKSSRFSETLSGVKVVRYPYALPFCLELLSGEGIVSKLKKNVLTVFLLPPFLISQFLFTLYWLYKFKPDVVLANWLVPQGLIIYIIKLLNPKVAYAVISHGGDAALIQLNALFRYIGYKILKNAQSVIAVSSFIKSKLAIRDMDPDKIHTIPMGVWLNDARPMPANRADLVFVGRLEEKKGVNYLIEAVKILKHDNPELSVTVVGDGTLRASLQTLTRQLDLSQNIDFKGALPQSQAKACIAAAKILVLPSINLQDDVEGMPTVILEAMSQRTAVITTDAGGITDVVDHGKNGFIVEQKDPAQLADAIRTLLADDQLRSDIEKTAYDLVCSRYTYDAMAERMILAVEGDTG